MKTLMQAVAWGLGVFLLVASGGNLAAVVVAVVLMGAALKA